MRILRITVCALVLLAMAVPTAAAAAGPPLDLGMTVPTEFADPGGPDCEFLAVGAAVDVGRVCVSGDAYSLEGSATGMQSNRIVNFHVLKEFVCDDGSGSFFVKLEVHYDYTKTPEYNVFNWTIKGGTGAYENLHGSGSGMGLYTSPDRVVDVYEGTAH